MNKPMAYSCHAIVAGLPSDATGDVGLQKDDLVSADWPHWPNTATYTGGGYDYQFAAPFQAMNEQQCPKSAPMHQGKDIGVNYSMWSPISEEFALQQQQQQPGYCGNSHYDTEDSWAPTMPPTPLLTPTWNCALMGSSQPAHRIIEAPDQVLAVSPASGSRKEQRAQGQPTKNTQILAWKTSQSACADTMATPPGKSECDRVEVCTSGSKRPRPEEPNVAAPVTGKKYRVKNRAAAKRCRDKSRQFELDLAAKEKQLTEDHIFLEASAAALREEILTLKNQILQHGDCDCEVIQTYISKVASQVSNSSACQQGPRR